ncbi:MAG: serine/threonine-protein phosphatase [Gemmatimonadota bacterium]|jgi:protein phosphatase
MIERLHAARRRRHGDEVRPSFSEIDAWGLTHTGKVRRDNQDHFFQGALVRGVSAEQTSLHGPGAGSPYMERVASLAIVADGVGGVEGGEEAARRAVDGLVTSVARSFCEADLRESADPEVFSRLLHGAALRVHESLLQKAEREGGVRRFASTLTLFLGLWPHAYILQVGDSRCYIFRGGRLSQISRDQTLAQDLVDNGVMSRTAAEKSRWAHVLSSAVGGEQAMPVVTRVERNRGTVILLCSDGLTKHVPDEMIEDRLASMSSARQVAEQLLEDALDDGGTDNVTLVVGRTLPGQGGGE